MHLEITLKLSYVVTSSIERQGRNEDYIVYSKKIDGIIISDLQKTQKYT